MNGVTRKKLYYELVHRDGEYCQCCGKLPSEGQLVIDHRDNNNSNNHLSNLQLLCRRCNYQKNPRRPVDLCEREYEKESELQKGTRLRPQVRKFIWHEIHERDEVPKKELLDAGAEEFDCSQITIERILDAMCSFRGSLRYVSRARTVTVTYKKELVEV